MSQLPAKLGSYPVERELGRGGMGVVYLARDPRLNRPVAIKVLPDQLALNPESLARFEREARLLASVNHPNIATIYGIEEDAPSATSTGSGPAPKQLLVLEYIPGDTLAVRTARGSLPLDETLDVCRQIALAIEAAHDAGVIHRDLKPGNVKITPDGQVKVLDFGLAKGSETVSDAELALSPTMTFAATAMGVILGTAGYMSPEQARGKPVDRRTDIWSFGCVLFECLAGKQIFEGETVSDTIAKILEREPEWGALPASTPPRVREILRRCLEKDLKKRQRDIGDVRIQLEEAVAERATSMRMLSEVPHATRAAAAPPSRSRTVAIAATLLIAGAAIGIGVWSAIGSRAGATATGITGPVRASIAVPRSIRANGASVSPDGQRFGLVGTGRNPDGSEDSVPRIYARGIHDNEFKAVPGTERAQNIVGSSDGQWLAIVKPASEQSTQRQLVKVRVDGSSPPVRIASMTDAWHHMVWLESGDFLVGTRDGTKYFRLPKGSDTPGPEIPFDLGGANGFAVFGSRLPGDRGVLFFVEVHSVRGWSRDVWVLDLTTNKAHRLVENVGTVAYAPTGHLVFSRGDTLMAAPFDLVSLAVTGDLTAISGDLRILASWDHGVFALSDNGTLVFPPGGLLGTDRRVVSIDAAGTVTPFGVERRGFELWPVPSEDGERIAVIMANEKNNYEIWTADRDRPRFVRTLSIPGADLGGPRWSPDGKWLAYSRGAQDKDDGVYVVNADGSGPAQMVISSAGAAVNALATSWSRDSSGVFVTKSIGQNFGRLLFVPLPVGGTPAAPRELRPGSNGDFNAQLSPSGHAIAFQSNQSGKSEVYVASYGTDGAMGRPLMVSSDGGGGIGWAADGRRLFFGSSEGKLMLVTVEAKPALTASTPVVVHDLKKLRTTGWGIQPDGRLLIIQRSEAEDDVTHFSVVFNWFDELRARMAKR
jgi:hypothetical protein